ncbi:ribonuclease P protein component [Fastidiosibacter lacustris]|uniref:ribonuclease P protein component n=1 Tax=Fastidiosibacter lacustris TaxID=2056695 RepID=UPI0013003334|nr:ribonuclease P protein component [Fastidiosibacter lacustris]
MLKADISLPLNALKKENILNAKRFNLGFSRICQKIHTKHFSYLIAQGEDLSTSIGIIAGKKKVKTAVKRNLCRRLNKEMFRHNKAKFTNTMLIVIVSQHADAATKEDLWCSINSFLAQYAQL